MTDTKSKILEVLAKPAKSLDDSKNRDDAIRAILKHAPAETGATVAIRGSITNPAATIEKYKAKGAATSGAMSRAQFDALSPADKMQFCRAGGRLTDGPKTPTPGAEQGAQIRTS